MTDEEIFAATIYMEARGESEEGQRWVAWVIKNRAHKNRSYWGGSKIRDVCLRQSQFSCWNGRTSLDVNEPQAFQTASRIAREVSGASISQDPTSGSDHYCNLSVLKTEPSWVKNVKFVRKVGSHSFYKGT